VRILVVEDELKVAAALEAGLEADNYTVRLAATGEEGFYLAHAEQFDLLILDVMLPGRDGLEILSTLRQRGLKTPVLLLTARDDVDDRVRGLDTGADDYLVKPFAFGELLARLRALARRGPVARPAVLEAGSLRLDPATRRVWRGGVEIELTQREFALLEALMRRAGEALSRFELLEAAWDSSYENRSNVIDVYVRYLRGKIDRPFGASGIETVRGHGYRLRPDGGES
jgi:two-component system, OmpR family, response regulator